MGVMVSNADVDMGIVCVAVGERVQDKKKRAEHRALGDAMCNCGY